MNYKEYFTGLYSAIRGRATDQTVGTQSGGPETYSEVSAANVTEDTALALSVVWACAKLLSEVFGALPVGI